MHKTASKMLITLNAPLHCDHCRKQGQEFHGLTSKSIHNQAETLYDKTRMRLTAAARRVPKPSKSTDHNPQAAAEAEATEPRRVSNDLRAAAKN